MVDDVSDGAMLLALLPNGSELPVPISLPGRAPLGVLGGASDAGGGDCGGCVCAVAVETANKPSAARAAGATRGVMAFLGDDLWR
jgi:hypothetical protein